jgi:hypothetical protein
MVAWFEDIKALTEKSGEERNAFVRRHASVRSASAGSARSASSDGGLEEDEADAVPFSANQSMTDQAIRDRSPYQPSRPSPGGRFPSDLMVNRNLQAPLSPSSGSSEVDNDLTTMSGGPQEAHPMYPAQSSVYHPVEPVQPAQYTQPIQLQPQPTTYANQYQPTQQSYDPLVANDTSYAPATQTYQAQPTYAENSYHEPSFDNSQPIQRHDSTTYSNWMAPAAGGAATGALASEAYRKKQLAQLHAQAHQQELNEQAEQSNQEQQYPVEQPRMRDSLNATSAQVPERHPDHILPDQIDDTGYVSQPTPSAPAAIDAPIAGNQTQLEQSSGHDTHATKSPFLGQPEEGAAPAFGKTINGGPVPVELVDTAESMAHPGMGKRMGTDISVSDLHVPGGFPMTTPGGTTATGRTPDGATQQPATFLRYN